MIEAPHTPASATTNTPVPHDIPAQPHTGDEAVLVPVDPSKGNSLALREVVRTSIDSLLGNKMRSLLTMLGIIIGVASVVALLSLGDGVSNLITGQFEGLGTNVLTVRPGSPDNQGPGATSAAQTLTLEDAEAIENLGLPVDGVAPQFGSSAQIVAPAADTNADVTGVTVAYYAVNNLELASGTFFDEGDVRGATAVVVLGANVAEDLFGSGEAVGETVRIKNQPTRVIGVLEGEGGAGFGSVDDQAFVPITFAQRRLFGGRTPDGNDWQVSSISIAVTESDDIDAVQARISTLLRQCHELAADGSEDDFNALNQASFLDTVNTITTALTAFLGSIAGISLLVGGIGIMNIMLVTVTERTREIGLRKAVGARGRDIMLQFVVEALVLSLAGGIIGLALGAGVALVVSLTGILQTSVSLYAVVLAVGFSMAVGLFFGIYPARRAARLNPIEALRHD
jgi:putative ABC transport system permease protein